MTEAEFERELRRLLGLVAAEIDRVFLGIKPEPSERPIVEFEIRNYRRAIPVLGQDQAEVIIPKY